MIQAFIVAMFWAAVAILPAQMVHSPVTPEVTSTSVSATSTDSLITKLGESTFKDCGAPADLQGREWYKPLMTALGTQNFSTLESAERDWKNNPSLYTSAKDAQEKNGKIVEGMVPAACYASNTGLVIAMGGTDYMVRGRLFVFDTKTKELRELPDVANADFHQTFMRFGIQKGTMLPVTASFGDAGISSETIYNLDLTAGKLIPKSSKECSMNWNTNKSDCEETQL